ncbi:MAG: arcadin 1 [Aigarchaeota archaeon]|nr:arcadin 1 [Aigarchaeota archaeon]MDW8092893.1 arcadin 1 [Nitrososphaerota archaeon]
MRVRVHRVTSYQDPETGRPGKLIELVEVRKSASQFTGMSEESMIAQRMIQGVFVQLQSMGLVPPISKDVILPKMTLILSEEEYDRLNVRFEVNEEFEVEFKDSKISFTPA